MPLDKHMLRACFPFLLRLKFLVLLGKLACELTSLPHLTNTEIKNYSYRARIAAKTDGWNQGCGTVVSRVATDS